MDRIPKAWMFTLGLSVLAVVAATIASSVKPASLSEDTQAAIEAESCVRYGRFECCVKPD